MNLPNNLTLARIFLTCIFIVLAAGGAAGAWLALACFITAAVTDFADGYIARKYGMVTAFGKIMDPVADKFLTLAAFFILAFDGLVPLWMVLVIAAREILVTASRIYRMTAGQVIPAEGSGKAKTVVQMATIVLALFYRAMPLEGLLGSCWQGAIFLFIILSVILTLWSGVEYFWGPFKERDA